MFRLILLFAVTLVLAAQTTDPWTAADLIAPADLAARLETGDRPPLIHVGFQVLYRGKHIAHSSYAGPASKPEGIAELMTAVKDAPKDAEIILYCGCCPWDKCPNVRPAFKALHDAGFSKVKVLTIPDRLATDWTAKGYPVEAGH